MALGSNRNDDLEIVGLGDDGDLYVVGWQDSSGKWHQSRSLSQKNDTGRRNSTQLIDAFEAFKAVPDTYTELDYYTPSVAEDILGHFQGMARHDQFYLLTHDRYLPGPAHGLIYVLDRDSKKEVIEFDTPEKDYRHPGGCQLVGDYLGVELELQNPDNDAVVRFYWLGSMCDRQPPTLLPSRYVVPRSTGGSSAIAVTDIGPRDKPSYVMALATKQGITIFTANDCLLDDPELSFTERFTLPTDKYPVIDKIHHGPDNINLVTDARGLYLISLGGNDDKNTIVDWADLYKVDFLQEQLVFLQTKHIITSGGGELGVHFRFGAGSWVENPSQLYLYGCARNISGFDPKPRKMLPVNEFIPERHPGGDRR